MIKGSVSSILFCAALTVAMSSSPAWAMNKVQSGDANITPEQKKEAELVIANLPVPAPPPPIKEFQRNSLIVRFAEGTDPAEFLNKNAIEFKDIKDIKIILPVFDPEILKEVIRKMRPIGTAVVNLASEEQPVAQAVEGLKPLEDELLGKDSDGWYWFMDKKYSETKKEIKSEEAVLLYHKITLKEGLTAGDAMEKLRENPAVEYIMPGELAAGSN